MEAHSKILGVPELMQRLTRPEWAEVPMQRFMDRWRSFVTLEAKEHAPRWRGQLRRSITSQRDRRKMPRWARVGTNNPAAKPMEFGTGLLSDAPDSKHRRYFPPPAALDAWAIAHGFHAERSDTAARSAVGLLGADRQTTAAGTYGVLVSQIIWKRGGTKPRRFLRNAAEEAEKKIPGWLEIAANEIEQMGAEAGRAG